MVGWPPLGSGSELPVLAAVGLLMAGVEVYVLTQLLPRRAGPPALTRMILGVAALVGSAAMLLSLVNIVLFPNSYTAATEVLWGLNFMMFVPVGLWFVALIVYRDRRIDPGSRSWPVLIAFTVTAGELLMGVLFTLDPAAPTLGLATIGSALTSAWFFWTMAAVMVAVVCWLPLERVERRALVGLAAMVVVAPWVVPAPIFGAVAAGGVMAAVAGAIVLHLRAGRAIDGRSGRWLFGVALALAVMATAQAFAAAAPGPTSELAFGAVGALVMGVELGFLLRRGLGSSGENGRADAAELTDGARAARASGTAESA